MRIDLPTAVKQALAARNGFRCSFPGCDVATVGPGIAPDETVSTGVAAHIYAASPTGPRGQSTLSPEDLSGIGNALWLCANHARLIDAHQGAEFSPARLQSFKASHESLIAFEQRGVAFDFGWIQSLVIEESPVFVQGSRLDFGRTTVIVGGNASGKTALCEWLAGCSEITSLKRWSAIGKSSGRTQVSFEALNPLPFMWRIRVYSRSNIQFEVNGSAVPRLNIPYAFVQASERPFQPKRPDETESGYLARWLRVDVAVVHNVIRSLAARGGHHVHNPRFVEEDGRQALVLDLDGTVAGLDFGSLSDTEQCRVIIEMAVELARFEAQHRPTMLLVDCVHRFDDGHFRDYLGFISAQSQMFQSVVTAPSEGFIPLTLGVDHLHVARLRGSERNVSIQ